MNNITHYSPLAFTRFGDWFINIGNIQSYGPVLCPMSGMLPDIIP